MVQEPLVGQGLLIIEASRSHRNSTLGKTPLDKYSTLYLQLTSVPITKSNNQVRTHYFSVVEGGGGDWPWDFINRIFR
jgi:hypothetical protein